MSVPAFLRRIFSGGGSDGGVRELAQLCEALLAESGEYASTALAREAVAKWQALDERSREQFFEVLAANYSPPAERLKDAAAAYQADPSSENLIRLQQATESPRRELFAAFSRRAVLVRTTVGRMQVTRISHEEGREDVAVFQDEAEALAHLARR